MIRAFFGIPIPSNVTRMLTGVQAGLDIGRIVPPENFHLTLAFLGEHPKPVLEDVHTLLDDYRFDPINLAIQGLGVFGGKKPRTLFAEVLTSQPLNSVRKRVRSAAREAGIELAHEQFRPHVTLARFGNGLVGPDALDLQAFISARMGRTHATFQATGFALFESRLGASAPHFEVLAEYPAVV